MRRLNTIAPIRTYLGAFLLPGLFLASSAFSQESETGTNTLPEQHLTLSKALDLASWQNPILVAKRKELGIAEGELRQASIYFQNNPELSLVYDRRRVPSSFNGAPVPSERFGEYELDLSQEFEVFGQPRARKRAAVAARDADSAEVETVEREILTEVRAVYYATQIAARRVELAEEQFRFGEGVLDLSRRQLDAGEIALTEYRQLEIQMATLKTVLLSARAESTASRNTLRLLLNFAPTQPLELSSELLQPSSLGLAESDFVRLAVNSSPLIRHARFRVERRDRERNLTKKEGRPNITASIFVANEDDGDDLIGLGLSVPIPLFNRNQGAVAAAEAAVDTEKARLVYITQAVEMQAKTAYTRLARTQEAAAHYHDTILSAIAANLAQLENSFRQGEIGMLELRINQRDLLDAQSDALNTLAQYYENLSELEGLLGRSLHGNN